MLTITHSPAEGTLIEGTSRGDGSAEILKTSGWRWSRQLSAWYVPRSRDQQPKSWVINATAAALQAAGFEVLIEISGERRGIEEIEADKAARSEARVERLQDRADRRIAASDALYERASGMAASIPFGQPILVGHHSEGRDRRHRDRIQRTYRKAFDVQAEGDAAQRAADAASSHQRARYSPIAVGNRIERLEAELRAAQRTNRSAEQARLAEELEYWRGVRTEQLASGEAIEYANVVRPGDEIRSGSRWYPVVRTNRKTVSVQVGRITQTLPYHHIQGHRRPPRDE